jgi:ParB-like chromosome segregation protein Spo0J
MASSLARAALLRKLQRVGEPPRDFWTYQQLAEEAGLHHKSVARIVKRLRLRTVRLTARAVGLDSAGRDAFMRSKYGKAALRRKAARTLRCSPAVQAQ